MELPNKIFSIKNDNNEHIELTLTDTLDYPKIKNFWGGYDFSGKLNLMIGGLNIEKAFFLFSTSALEKFSQELEVCYKKLKGHAIYKPTAHDATPLQIDIEFTREGNCEINCNYKDNENLLKLQFNTNQSYLKGSIEDLKSFLREIT